MSSSDMYSYSSSYSTSADDIYDHDHIDFVGHILNHKYIIIHKLGYGTFSTVWLGYNYKNNYFYAIKIQHADDYDGAEDEIQRFTKINKNPSPYLSKLLDHFEYNSDEGCHLCMVFPLLAGSLYDIITSDQYKTGIPIPIVKRILTQLLYAMLELNEMCHLLHTDIKPENILVTGISSHVQSIIDNFTKLNFSKIYRKKRSRKHNKKFTRNDPLKDAVKDILSRLDTIPLDSDNDSNSKPCPIPDKYINNIHIVLSDFGGCYELSDHMSFNIQTRYYRSPEILLHHSFDATCDVWSVGCVLYELLTGQILFDPDKSDRFSRDRHQLYRIQAILGKFPTSFIDSSIKKNVFFKNNGLIKGVSHITYVPLSKLIFERLGSICSPEQLLLITDLLIKLLGLTPDQRISVSQALHHPWLISI